MTTLLTDLLREQDHEKRTLVLEELLKKRADPDDPLYELLTFLSLTLKTQEQITTIGQQIPEQLHAAMDEIDERLDAHAAKWRTLASELVPKSTEPVEAKVQKTEPEPQPREPEISHIDIGKVELYTRLTTTALCAVLFLSGLIGGFGIRTVYPQYPTQTARDIEYGRQYQAMYAHMPSDMKDWIRRWMGGR